MDKEISRKRVGNTTVTCVTILIPLTPSQSDKMENHSLADRIANLAKDFHVDWAIRVNGDSVTAEISHNHKESVVTSQMLHDDEVNAINFMTAVDRLDLTEQGSEECEEEFVNNNDIPGLRKLMKEIIDDPNIVMAGLVTEVSPFGIALGKGHISKPVLNQMCQAWLDIYKEA